MPPPPSTMHPAHSAPQMDMYLAAVASQWRLIYTSFPGLSLGQTRMQFADIRHALEAYSSIAHDALAKSMHDKANGKEASLLTMCRLVCDTESLFLA